ncbi:MAG: apolipoprotein N-acyltransferase [Ruminococcaceae bacterium]|nr:apolipoprotein N-acyltransferase [Oscillospiraceae bacterium]
MTFGFVKAFTGRDDMKTKTQSRGILPLLLCGAVFTALTLVFPQAGLLQWFTMIPLAAGLFRLCESPILTLRRAYGYGFLTVYVYYLVLYHWIVNLYPLDFVGLDNAASAAVVAVGWFGLPLLQAIPGGLIFLLFAALSKTPLFDRAPLLRPFALSALWVLFEWSSTLGWTGVPWGRLALGQIECLPLLQSASLFGSYFITFLIVAVNALLAYAILYNMRASVCGLLASILFCSNFVFGILSMNLPSRTDAETLRVAVVQGNIDSHEKWGPDSVQTTRERYGELTRRAAEQGADLIVWPETVFPSPLNHSATTRIFLSELAQECNVTLLVGSTYYVKDESNYNALFIVTPDGAIDLDHFYAKRHLVPFGEYVPMRDVIMTLVPPLANLSALGEDLTPGEDSANFETAWGSIGALICFDSIYETLALDSVRDGADLLVLSSNDSWFYDSAGIYQHQAQAQLRAIETGRDLVRAGNTGISSAVTAKGECIAWIDPLTEGYAVADVSLRSTDTLYVCVGNLFVYLCAAFCLLLLGAGYVQKRRYPHALPRFCRSDRLF